MADTKLEVVDTKRFVFHALKAASTSKYMHDKQIKDLIAHTKCYYTTEASDEELICIFKKALRTLGW